MRRNLLLLRFLPLSSHHLHPHQVKKVFLALPAEIQARVLLTAIRHPAARPSAGGADTCPPGQSGAVLADASSQAHIVRDLLSAGGVVAVQLVLAPALAPALPLAPTPTPTLTLTLTLTLTRRPSV